MIFLVLFGKIMFLFLENMILTLDRKWKMIFFQKKYKEIWYFPQVFRKEGLFKKKNRAETWSFLYYLERWYFFPKNTIFFPWPGSQRWPSSRNTWIYDIFCVQVWVLQTWCHALLPKKKNQRWSYPAKIHLKVIDFLDWHPGKSSNNSLYLHRDLYGRFHVMLSSQKKQET